MQDGRLSAGCEALGDQARVLTCRASARCTAPPAACCKAAPLLWPRRPACCPSPDQCLRARHERVVSSNEIRLLSAPGKVAPLSRGGALEIAVGCICKSACACARLRAFSMGHAMDKRNSQCMHGSALGTAWLASRTATPRGTHAEVCPVAGGAGRTEAVGGRLPCRVGRREEHDAAAGAAPGKRRGRPTAHVPRRDAHVLVGAQVVRDALRAFGALRRSVGTCCSTGACTMFVCGERLRPIDTTAQRGACRCSCRCAQRA